MLVRQDVSPISCDSSCSVTSIIIYRMGILSLGGGRGGVQLGPSEGKHDRRRYYVTMISTFFSKLFFLSSVQQFLLRWNTRNENSFCSTKEQSEIRRANVESWDFVCDPRKKTTSSIKPVPQDSNVMCSSIIYRFVKRDWALSCSIGELLFIVVCGTLLGDRALAEVYLEPGTVQNHNRTVLDWLGGRIVPLDTLSRLNHYLCLFLS